MPKFEHTIQINAPTETVFEYLLDPDAPMAVNASIHEMTEVEEQSDGGYSAHMTCKIMGLKTDCNFEADVVEPNEEVAYRFDGVGMNGTLTWRLNDHGETTELTEHGDYKMTGTVLDHVLEPVAKKYNERQFQTALNNFKTYVEEHAAIIA